MTKDAILGMILSIPIIIGITILAIPVIIVSCITGIDMAIIIQNLLVFAAAVFLVWLFSRFQIIENGILGLIVGSAIYTHFEWHPVFCCLAGLAVVCFLFILSNKKVGFWIKTIPFSLLITIIVYWIFYSETGLFPAADKIWKTTFFVIFLLENLYIRCTRFTIMNAAFHKKTEDDKNIFKEGEVNKAPTDYKEKKLSIAAEATEVNNADGLYLLDRVYLFSKKNSFWDGKLEENVEKKIYQELRMFIDGSYIILPHIAFREIFWWGEWKHDWRLTNSVTKMHFDFGIYNADLQPVLFVEIHGKDHKEDPKVIERDKFKTEVMEYCGMKLITIDCSQFVPDQEIRDKLITSIKREIPDRQACATYCPHCGKLGKNSLMRIKLNNKGEYFYGCSTYSKERTDNCPGLSINEVPPLYMGIPIAKEKM